jgi:microcystin-dependent protein
MASNLRVDSIVPATGGSVSIGTATGGVNIPGNLGIGGTLTYEDVTNVDSVGLVTARAGIKIGPSAGVAATIFADGSINTSGIITATTFHGSGANLTGVVSIPTGMIAPFAMSSPPTGWLECNGATISRSTYATLFAAIGTTYGAGDGSSTFLLPDLRATFIRGFDNSRGIDTGRTFGSFQDQGIPAMKGDIADAHGQSRTQTNAVSGFTNVFEGVGTSSWRTSIESSSGQYAEVRFDSTRIVPDAPHGGVRPRNLALMYMIKI